MSDWTTQPSTPAAIIELVMIAARCLLNLTPTRHTTSLHIILININTIENTNTYTMQGVYKKFTKIQPFLGDTLYIMYNLKHV